MATRLQPLPEYPVFERKPIKRYPGIIITLIIVTILIAVTCIVVYAIFRGRLATAVSRCEPGLCVVTLSTGVKRCPNSDTEQMIYNNALEDCSSGNYCQSDRAPCAVLAGGVLNCNGVCGIGNSQCNCLKVGA